MKRGITVGLGVVVATSVALGSPAGARAEGVADPGAAVSASAPSGSGASLADLTVASRAAADRYNAAEARYAKAAEAWKSSERVSTMARVELAVAKSALDAEAVRAYQGSGAEIGSSFLFGGDLEVLTLAGRAERSHSEEVDLYSRARAAVEASSAVEEHAHSEVARLGAERDATLAEAKTAADAEIQAMEAAASLPAAVGASSPQDPASLPADLLSKAESTDPGDGPQSPVDHLRPRAERAKLLVEKLFGVTDIGGWRPTDAISQDHPQGRAIDVMISPGKAALGGDLLLGWRIARWAQVNSKSLGVTYIIWQGRIWSTTYAAEGWRDYTKNFPYGTYVTPTTLHMDHVHISFAGSGTDVSTALLKDPPLDAEPLPAPEGTGKPGQGGSSSAQPGATASPSPAPTTSTPASSPSAAPPPAPGPAPSTTPSSKPTPAPPSTGPGPTPSPPGSQGPLDPLPKPTLLP